MRDIIALSAPWLWIDNFHMFHCYRALLLSRALPRRIYIHEVGHCLSGNSYPEAVLPKMFSDLRMSTLGTETIADYLSYEIAGQLSFPIKGFPECFWALHPIDVGNLHGSECDATSLTPLEGAAV